MMNWLHCNKCGVTCTAESDTELFVGFCYHVLCNKCNVLKTCPIDKRPFKGIKINDSMPEKLRSYFDDPDILLTSWKKCIRFQFEQRALCEEVEYTKNLKQMRQYKEQINLFIKTKAVLKANIEKDVKRNNKMKMYLQYCFQKQEELSDVSRTSTETTNFSSMLGESGVDLQFDDLNSSG